MVFKKSLDYLIENISQNKEKFSFAEMKIRNLNLKKEIIGINNLLIFYEHYLNKNIDYLTRINLIKIIYNLKRNNNELNFSYHLKNKFQNGLFLDLKEEDILNIFKLRFKGFEKRNYNSLLEKSILEYKLNFDYYDNNSILIFYKRDNTITASSRIVLDNNNFLPSEKLFNNRNGFNKLRFEEFKNNKNIAEISRSVIDPKYQSKGTEFREIFSQIYKLKGVLNIGTYVTAIANEDYKLYKKAGFYEIGKGIGYNGIDKNVLYLAWDVKNVNAFFKKIFLKKRN